MNNDYCLMIIGRWLALLLFLFPFAAAAQVVRHNLDSIYVYCKFPDLVSAIKKENKKEVADLKISALSTIRKNFRDTISLEDTTRFSDGDTWGFDYEITNLFRNNKLRVFDKVNKRMVLTIRKRKDGIQGQVTYFTYYDADTNKELFHELIKSWQKF